MIYAYENHLTFHTYEKGSANSAQIQKNFAKISKTNDQREDCISLLRVSYKSFPMFQIRTTIKSD